MDPGQKAELGSVWTIWREAFWGTPGLQSVRGTRQAGPTCIMVHIAPQKSYLLFKPSLLPVVHVWGPGPCLPVCPNVSQAPLGAIGLRATGWVV